MNKDLLFEQLDRYYEASAEYIKQQKHFSVKFDNPVEYRIILFVISNKLMELDGAKSQ